MQVCHQAYVTLIPVVPLKFAHMGGCHVNFGHLNANVIFMSVHEIQYTTGIHIFADVHVDESQYIPQATLGVDKGGFSTFAICRWERNQTWVPVKCIYRPSCYNYLCMPHSNALPVNVCSYIAEW